MLKILKHLKKSIPYILAVMVLLVIQAQCDLALPTYMSQIVNVGVQQGGVEYVTPLEVRKSELDKLSLLMSKEDAAFVLGFYSSNPDNSETYLLKDNVSDKDFEKLDSVLSLPVMALFTMGSGFGQDGNSTLGFSPEDFTGFDLSTLDDKTKSALMSLPENATPFDILAVLPDNIRDNISGLVREQLNSAAEQLGNSVYQMGIQWVRSEYDAIGKDTTPIYKSFFWNAALIMFAYALTFSIATALVAFCSARIGASLSRDLRDDIFRTVVSLSNKEFNQFSTSSLITRCTNDIQQVLMLIIMGLRGLLYAPIIGIGALVKVMGQDSGMTWIVGLAVGLVVIVVLILMSMAMPNFRKLQSLVDRLNLVSREILTGLPVIRAFAREKHEEARFDKASSDLKKTQLFVNRVMACAFPMMGLIMNGISILIIWVGASKIDSSSMQVGSIMALTQYTMQIMMAFMMLSMMSILMPRAYISATRIAEVINTENSVRDPKEPRSFPTDNKGLVEFQNVSFRYPGTSENILSGITFRAHPGQTTAFIGSTGSGKSTLINLVPRFYDVTEGQILVSGIDVRNVTKHDLRARIGYVPQKGQLFTGTVESNIGYSMDEINLEKIKSAAEIAQAAEFIGEMAEEYDSRISQGGTNVSGGQRQRLSIARAVAKDPEIYIFDDSFSALDFKTDAALRKALFEATSESTIMIVAQRISTVLNADQIIVLDEGKIVGQGTHQSLMEDCEIYRQIALSQLTLEEMDI